MGEGNFPNYGKTNECGLVVHIYAFERATFARNTFYYETKQRNILNYSTAGFARLNLIMVFCSITTLHDETKLHGISITTATSTNTISLREINKVSVGIIYPFTRDRRHNIY